MRKYEIVLIVNQEVPYQGVAVISKKIESLMDDKGKIVASEYWGLRELAYPIKNHKKARYFMISAEMTPDIVKTISEYIKINESIIRSAIYAVENFETTHSIMLTYTKNLIDTIQDSEYNSVFSNAVVLKNHHTNKN